MTDIVERLRDGFKPTRAELREAADEIERLRNNLEVSLKQFEELAWQHAATVERCAQVVEALHWSATREDAAAAIRALKDKP